MDVPPTSTNVSYLDNEFVIPAPVEFAALDALPWVPDAAIFVVPLRDTDRITAIVVPPLVMAIVLPPETLVMTDPDRVINAVLPPVTLVITEPDCVISVVLPPEILVTTEAGCVIRVVAPPMTDIDVVPPTTDDSITIETSGSVMGVFPLLTVVG